MAIVQISQIKHRHGVHSDLPQRATAELGWSVDQRRLYIGNGTLAEGAPEVGNTEILTEFSNMPNYTVYTVGVSDTTTANVTNAISTYNQPALSIQYAIVKDDGNSRVGWLKFAKNRQTNDFYFDEEFSESANCGVTFGVVNVGTAGDAGSYSQLTATAGNGDVQMKYTVSTLAF